MDSPIKLSFATARKMTGEMNLKATEKWMRVVSTALSEYYEEYTQ